MIKPKPGCVLVFSGGQDSTTCLYWAKKHYGHVHAVTFNYGQRHSREILAAQTIVEIAGVASYEVIDIPQVLKGTSPLVKPTAELEQYIGWEVLPGGLEKTFVPMRNQMFLTIAANRAAIANIPTLVTGVCEEDYGGYPDCRRVFIDSLEQTIRLSLDSDDLPALRSFSIQTPLMHLTKAETVNEALALPGCYTALAYSHTSYDGQYPPTGHDHATLLRAKGFEQAGVPDPLVVRAWLDGLMDLPHTENYTKWRHVLEKLGPDNFSSLEETLQKTLGVFS